MKTARENILIYGLIDWVNLGGVHSYALQEDRSASLSEVQQKTLDTIRSLVSDGLVELGDLAGEDGSFVAWNTQLDESMKEIHDIYVNHFDDSLTWTIYCWLNLTGKGEQVAESLEQKYAKVPSDS
jgi:hypothetical protein